MAEQNGESYDIPIRRQFQVYEITIGRFVVINGGARDDGDEGGMLCKAISRRLACFKYPLTFPTEEDAQLWIKQGCRMTEKGMCWSTGFFHEAGNIPLKVAEAAERAMGTASMSGVFNGLASTYQKAWAKAHQGLKAAIGKARDEPPKRGSTHEPH